MENRGNTKEWNTKEIGWVG